MRPGEITFNTIMSIDLYSWSSGLDSQLIREHVRVNQEIYDYLYLYCDGDMAQWNQMSDMQKIDLGMSVWRLIIRVCCRQKTGKSRYQLYVLTRFMHKLIPHDSTKFVLTAGEAIELPYDSYIKLTYIMRYTFVAMGGFEALVRFVGFEALYEYCFEDPVDSCELGDFIDLLTSYSKHATLTVIVSVYVQVPVPDTVVEYLNRGLCIKGPSTGKLLPHITTILSCKHSDNANSGAVFNNRSDNNCVFELCFVAPSVFLENTIMQYNTTLFEDCFASPTMDVHHLTLNFNTLQLLYEMSWLVKEHWREIDEHMDDVYNKVISRKLWYVRLLLEPFLTVNDRMKMVFKEDANMDSFIDVLSRIRAPMFCSNGKSLWKNCGNVYMVPVANYLKNYKNVTYSV